MIMEMHAQPLMMVNVETAAVIADGHGLMATQLDINPRTLTADARQVLNNSSNDIS
jgi:hypothetical protein